MNRYSRISLRTLTTPVCNSPCTLLINGTGRVCSRNFTRRMTSGSLRFHSPISQEIDKCNLNDCAQCLRELGVVDARFTLVLRKFICKSISELCHKSFVSNMELKLGRLTDHRPFAAQCLQVGIRAFNTLSVGQILHQFRAHESPLSALTSENKSKTRLIKRTCGWLPFRQLVF